MARMIQPGRLDHRVALQEELRTPDGAGGYDLVWQTVSPLWAAVEPLSGGEVLQSEQLQRRDLYRFTIRNRPGITVAHRLLWQGQTLNIVSAVDPGPRAAFRVIEAVSGGPT